MAQFVEDGPLNYRVVLLTSLLLVILVVAASGADTPIPRRISPSAILYTYANGVRLIVQESRHAPLVAMEVWVAAGSSRETAANNGCAHFLEHLVFKADPSKGSESLDEAAESVGASVNAVTDRDWTRFYTTVPSARWQPLLTSLARAVLQPSLVASDVEAERRVILDEIAHDDDTPLRSAMRSLYATALNGHPYAHPVTGSRDSVTALTRDAIAAFHKRWYAGANVTVVLVGDLSAKPAADQVGRLFSDALPASGSSISRQAGGSTFHGIKAARIGEEAIAVGFPAPRASDIRGVAAMDILLTVLGGHENSRLHNRLQTNHPLASATKCVYAASIGPGVVGVVAYPTPGNAQACEEAIRSELEDLRDHGITAQELRGAKSRLRGAAIFDAETFAGRAEKLGFYATVARPEIALTYPDIVASLTLAEVNAAARRWLSPDRDLMMPDATGRGSRLPMPAPSSDTRAAPARESPSAVKSTLANGLRVIVRPEATSELVSVNAFVRAGCAQEPPGRQGVSQLVANALLSRTRFATGTHLIKLLGGFGGGVTVDWNPDFTRIAVAVTRPYATNALAFLADLLKHSEFDDNDVLAASRRAQGYRGNGGLRPILQRLSESATALFEGHPYSRLFGATESQLRAIRAREVREFFKAHYTPANTVIVVTGGASQTETLQLAERLFINWEPDVTPWSPAPVPKRLNETICVSEIRNSAYLLALFQMPGSESKDYAVAIVVDALLGAGKSSRLFVGLRERLGIGYDVGSALSPLRACSILAAFVQFASGKEDDKRNAVDEVRERALGIVHGLADVPPTPDELARAKQIAAVQYLLRHQRASDRAYWYGFWEAAGRGFEADARFIGEIAAVTSADVRRVCQEHLAGYAIRLIPPER